MQSPVEAQQDEGFKWSFGGAKKFAKNLKKSFA